MESVYQNSKPTCRELSALVEPFNMVSKPNSKGVQPDCTCSEPTSRRESAGVHPVLQFQNLHPGNCHRGVHSFLPFPTLPLGNCWPWV